MSLHSFLRSILFYAQATFLTILALAPAFLFFLLILYFLQRDPVLKPTLSLYFCFPLLIQTILTARNTFYLSSAFQFQSVQPESLTIYSFKSVSQSLHSFIVLPPVLFFLLLPLCLVSRPHSRAAANVGKPVITDWFKYICNRELIF